MTVRLTRQANVTTWHNRVEWVRNLPIGEKHLRAAFVNV